MHSQRRPEGPVLNSHAREGVDQVWTKMSEPEGATEIRGHVAESVGPSSLKNLRATSTTPLQAWLLTTGPSGLRMPGLLEATAEVEKHGSGKVKIEPYFKYDF